MNDLRFALRTLRKSPGSTAAAVACLAIGIGANTAIFSVVNAVLLRLLDAPDPERLVGVRETFGDGGQGSVSLPNLRDWRERNHSLEALEAFFQVSFNLRGSESPERAAGAGVSTGYFEAMGVNPALGRTFAAEEDQPGGNRVVVLSDRLWQRVFGADPGVVGRDIRINTEQYTVVGVMPARFRL